MPAIEAALPQPPPPPAADDDDEPDATTACRYAYVRLEDVSTRYLPGRGFQDGQLVWVCKSKGRKKCKKPRSSSGKQDSSSATPSSPKQDGTNPRDDTAGATGVLRCPTENGSLKGKSHFNQCPNNRLELFLRARVVQPPEGRSVRGDDDGDDDEDDRVRVRYPRGSTYRVRRDHLIPVLERQSRIVVVVGETPPYRKCCAVHTLPHETFVEIGCDLGHNVQRVHETREKLEADGLLIASPMSRERALVVGVDKSPFSVEKAKESYPHLAFALWDPLEHPTSALHEGLGLSQEEEFQPDVIAVDINGSRELPAVLACLSSLWAIHRWEPRLVIVKSRALHAHLQERPAIVS